MADHDFSMKPIILGHKWAQTSFGLTHLAGAENS
jgi:hypothetical protein